jgi:cell division protein FtsX
MLILARPHIIATMRENTWIRGPTFITVAITLTTVLYSAMTIWFIIQLIQDVTAV